MAFEYGQIVEISKSGVSDFLLWNYAIDFLSTELPKFKSSNPAEFEDWYAHLNPDTERPPVNKILQGKKESSSVWKQPYQILYPESLQNRITSFIDSSSRDLDSRPHVGVVFRSSDERGIRRDEIVVQTTELYPLENIGQESESTWGGAKNRHIGWNSFKVIDMGTIKSAHYEFEVNPSSIETLVAQTMREKAKLSDPFFQHLQSNPYTRALSSRRASMLGHLAESLKDGGNNLYPIIANHDNSQFFPSPNTGYFLVIKKEEKALASFGKLMKLANREKINDPESLLELALLGKACSRGENTLYTVFELAQDSINELSKETPTEVELTGKATQNPKTHQEFADLQIIGYD
ncbi:MAG: hypothetical protein WCI72_04100 [archaeon]